MIDILMATYNGEKYIRQQVDSILNQSYKNFNLIVKDDFSTDNTYSILKEYEAKYPEKIVVHRGEKRAGSAEENFISMSKYIKSDYVMFADQDDVWLKDKIKNAYTTMLKTELDQKSSKATLVYSNLKIVSKDLNIISHSFYDFQKLSPHRNNLKSLLVQNVVVGCTVIINKPMINYFKKIKYNKKIIMHDWILALIATSEGKIVYLDKTDILYRQHQNNSVGAKKIFSFSNFKKLKKYYINLENTFKQAEYLLKIFDDKLSIETKILLNIYYKIYYTTKFKKIYYIWKNKFYKTKLYRIIFQFLIILLYG